MRPRAITGLGIASALGIGAEDTFRALAASPDAAKKAAEEPRPPITSFDVSSYDNPPIIEVPSFDPTKQLGDKGLRTLDRLTKLLVVAARLSLEHAGLKTPKREAKTDTDDKEIGWTALSPERVGVCCSNAYGSLEAITELDRVAVLEDARYINPAKFPNTVSNSASGYVSIWEDLRALNVSVSDGNCGALDAMSCADIFLETGRADAIITGGGESMSEALFLAFDKLGALINHEEEGQKGQRPKSTRAKLGEGAAFLVLEPMDLARARGAKVLGAVTGYGTAFIAPERHLKRAEVTLLFTSATALERAIAQALEDASIPASSVDLVVSGLSGIAQFDDEERKAIANIIGPSVAIAAPKLLFGETLGAGGALAMAASLAWLDGASPASCLVAGALPKKLDTIVITSVGYYGNASALVMSRADEPRTTSSPVVVR